MHLNKTAPRLYNNIKKIETELRVYQNVPREELLQQCIKNKLIVTLEKYNEQIDRNSDYLLTRSSTKVLKALTKLQKKNDKEILENMQNSLSEEDELPFNDEEKETNWDD